jgi:hypothetical protein
MRTFHSFEDMAQANAAPEPAPVLEAFSGSAIVRWANTIKYGLRDKIAKQEANRNQEYAALLRTYSNLWNENPITGSMNVETIKLLKAAAEPYATMDWNEQKYFVGISTSLDELLADQEALPNGVDTEQNMPMAGGGGSMPPMGTDFGPEQNAPPGAGGPGIPGAEGGIPGAEGGIPGAEGGAGGAGGPAPMPGVEQPLPGSEIPPPGEPGQPIPGEEELPPGKRRPAPTV